MTTPIYELGADHYEQDYASQRWANAGGGIQSLGFYYAAIRALEGSVFQAILGQARTIHDYGCGLGDGCAVLQSCYPRANVTGFDFAATAQAQARWPTIRFAPTDLRSLKHVPDADVIWTSHTLEHVPDADAVVRLLRQACYWLVVIVPPYAGGLQDSTHFAAEPVQEWLARIKPPAIFQMEFTTTRRFGPSDKDLLSETSILLVFQGAR